MKQQFLKELEIGSKNAIFKKQIIEYYINNGSFTITDLAKEMDLSVPTVTKLVLEMSEDGFINDLGKLETAGGRPPILYGLNPDSGYFIGVDTKFNSIDIGVINLKGDMVEMKMGIPYQNSNSVESLNQLCQLIVNFINELSINKEKIFFLHIKGLTF